MCARFAIARGPGERLLRRESGKFGKTYPRPILLGPRNIALDSPADGACQESPSALLASLRAAPEVPVNPHVDSPLVRNATCRAVARAGFDPDTLRL